MPTKTQIIDLRDISSQVAILSSRLVAIKDEIQEEYSSLDEADQENSDLETQAATLEEASAFLDQAESLIDDLLPAPSQPAA